MTFQRRPHCHMRLVTPPPCRLLRPQCRPTHSHVRPWQSSHTYARLQRRPRAAPGASPALPLAAPALLRHPPCVLPSSRLVLCRSRFMLGIFGTSSFAGNLPLRLQHLLHHRCPPVASPGALPDSIAAHAPSVVVPQLPKAAVLVSLVVNLHRMTTWAKLGFRQPALFHTTPLSPIPKSFLHGLLSETVYCAQPSRFEDSAHPEHLSPWLA
jgi:hypothetical protein